MRLTVASTANELADARALVKEYVASLEVSLDFQDFSDELARFPAEYVPPSGAVLLAYEAGSPVGVVALRALAPSVCEMKRMYVRPLYRGKGIGRELAHRLIEIGRSRGYSAMRLDTLATMDAAIGLYRSLGFREIPPYRFNPIPGARYLELELTGPLGARPGNGPPGTASGQPDRPLGPE